MIGLLLAVAGALFGILAPPECGPGEPIAETYADGARYVGIIGDCEWIAGFAIAPDGTIELVLGED